MPSPGTGFMSERIFEGAQPGVALGWLFHSIESFLQDLQVGGLTEFLPSTINPFFLERVFGRAIVLVKNPEYAGKGNCVSL